MPVSWYGKRCHNIAVSAKQICDAEGNSYACTGSLMHKTHWGTKGVNKNPSSLYSQVDSSFWKSGLTPNLMAFWMFKLQFVLWAGGIDCYHQYVTCLPHSERRKTVFYPQTCLLSSCYCYYSNRYGFEIRLGTPRSLNAVLVPRADSTCAPFLVQHGGPCCTAITWSSTSHLWWWQSFNQTSCLHRILSIAVCPTQNVQRMGSVLTIHQRGHGKLLIQLNLS